MFDSNAFSHSLPRPSMQTKWVVSILTVSAILAPMRSTAPSRLSRNAAGRTPGVTVIPLNSVILCVLTASFSLLYCPADVRNMRWKVYSVSTANPDTFVACMPLSWGIRPALAPLRYKVRLRSSAVASTILSHSRTTEVWVAFLQRITGGAGEATP